MITPQELTWIKNAQREFEQTFNKKLIINFTEMKSLPVAFFELLSNPQFRKNSPIDELYIKNLLLKHNLSIELVQTPQQFHKKARKEFLIEFCTMVMSQNWSMDDCATKMNIDRTTIYYYADIDSYAKVRRERGRRKSIIKV